MARPKREKKIRLNLTLDPRAHEKLESLVRRSRCANFSEVVRKALSVLDLALENRDEGGDLLIRDKDGNIERLMFDY